MKKCLIITTVNAPTKAIYEFIKTDFEVIIVGDQKTPQDYHDLDCIFLDMKEQEKLFPKFHQLLPINHYARKNMGYLYAITRGYDFIAELAGRISARYLSGYPCWLAVF